MPTTPNKGYSVPTTGTEEGTWGDDLNNNTIAVIDNNLGGLANIGLTNADVTLTAAQSQMGVLRLTGILTADVTVTTACIGYTLIENLTTGAFDVTFTNGVGSGVPVAQARSALVVTDPTNGARLWSFDNLTPEQLTALINPFVADTGTGSGGSAGTKGLVPAPAAGDAAAGKILGASGGWVSMTSGIALAAAQGLQIVNNTAAPNSKADITVNQAILTTAAGVPVFYSGGTNSVNLTVNGVNGLDAGSVANSTFYNLYLISNGSTFASLASLSATAPALPSGFTFFMRVGAVQTDSSGNLRRTKQLGRRTVFTASLQTVTTTQTVTAATFFPPTSTVWKMFLTNPGNSSGSVSDGNGVLYGQAAGNVGREVDFNIDMFAAGTTFFFANGLGTTSLTIVGWEDSVNAC